MHADLLRTPEFTDRLDGLQPSNGKASGRGFVSLVGAGPGDPELLTVRAVRRITDADVVIYDNLVGAEIRALIPPRTECIYVGKEASNHALPQDEISALLVAQARLGRRVVRLKGGDPFVFGRGGEEMQTLIAAGVAFEIVPGITAALGAAASTGIPLTHRDYAQSCVFVTGHRQDGSLDLDWQTLSRRNQTLVIYMGIGAIAGISERLIAHGLSPATPAAIVRRATLPDQEVLTGTLADIAGRAGQRGIRPPALIVIGEVVRLYAPQAGLGAAAAIA